jgi:nucleotide-binding universal stress UspA family protein
MSHSTRSAQEQLAIGRETATVTVVVDGSTSGWDALEWAAAEASVRDHGLRIVHIVNWPWALDPFGNLTVGVGDSHVRQQAEAVLDEAVQRARSVSSSLAITTRLQMGTVIPESSDLVVVGRRLRGRALRTKDSVAVVGLVGEGSRGPSTGRVVVGVDGKSGSAAALEFAFRAAERRGLGLTVMHAVDVALTSWRDAFPGVEVQNKVVDGPAAPALVAESAGAALVVLGAPKHGRLHRVLFGSVARDVLRFVRSPVAVIRP